MIKNFSVIVKYSRHTHNLEYVLYPVSMRQQFQLPVYGFISLTKASFTVVGIFKCQ